jgi:excisionase family DNA binding protein
MRNSQRPEDGEVQNSVKAFQGAIPFALRLTCTIEEACEATGLGRTKLYELIDGGHLDTTTIGRRRLVLVRSLRRLIGDEAG